jgi:hypothetical protein
VKYKAFAVTVGLGAMLGGCATTSEAPVYSVTSTTSALVAAAHPAPPAPPAITIALQHPKVSEELEHSALVRRIAVEDTDEPVGDALERVLATKLRERIPNGAIETMEQSTRPDAMVTVDMLRFEISTEDTVVLHARVEIESRQQPATARTVTLLARPRGASDPAVADAMGELMGGLADAIAGMLPLT